MGAPSWKWAQSGIGCACLPRAETARGRCEPGESLPRACGNLLHSNDFGRWRPLLSGCWEWQDRWPEGGKLKEVVEWALQRDRRGGKGSLDDGKIFIRDGELFG